MSIETSIGLLRTISEPVNTAEENLELYFKQLESEIQAHENGVGLAAVQIGVLKRVAILRPNVKDKARIIRIWNPEIIEHEVPTHHSEGCLSVPGLIKSVERFTNLTLKNGDGKIYALEGFEAVIAQHEIDHMNGITIQDREYRALQIGRNEPCPCGARTPQGGLIKFKKCHLGREAELQQILIERAIESPK